MRSAASSCGEQLFEERERLADLALGDAPDRVADVVEDVVADGDRLVDDVEEDLAPDSPEVDRRAVALDGDRPCPARLGTYVLLHFTPARLDDRARDDRLAERQAAVARRHGGVAQHPGAGAEPRAGRARRAARSGTRRRSARPEGRPSGAGPARRAPPSRPRACCGSAPTPSPAARPSINSPASARIAGRRSSSDRPGPSADRERVASIFVRIGREVPLQRDLALVARLRPAEAQRADRVEVPADAVRGRRVHAAGEHLPHDRASSRAGDAARRAGSGRSGRRRRTRRRAARAPDARPAGWPGRRPRAESGGTWRCARSGA